MPSPSQIVLATEDAAAINDQADEIVVGQWYFVDDQEKCDDDGFYIEDRELRPPMQWLGCVTRVGSNYAKLEGVHHQARIHFDDFDNRCHRSLEYRDVIEEHVSTHRQAMADTLLEIKELCRRLGVTPRDVIPDLSSGRDSETRTLSAVGSNGAVEKYETDLMLAKKKTLPELYEKMEESSNEMANWLAAEMIPHKAMVKAYKKSSDIIDSRIFNLKLYAGLTETIELVCDGEPAGMTEPLRVMQRCGYMDEECIAAYTIGGIDCETIGDFDRWFVNHFRRLLPFPRCVMAFRVRRERKRRRADLLYQAYVNIQLGDADEWTFLYIRNGDRLYRMHCDLDFGEHLFPGRDVLDMTEPMLAKVYGREIKFVSVREKQHAMGQWREELKAWRDDVKKWKAFKKKYPGHEIDRRGDWSYGKDESGEGNPIGIHKPSPPEKPYEEYNVPFTKRSVYYDDMRAKLESEIQSYNRIGLIIQGLFDRTETLHPHPTVATWKGEGYELVYDSDRALHHGDPPNWQAYIDRCNESLGPDSYTIGQDDVWARREAEKENNRGYYDSRNRDLEYYRPDGNPGPGVIAKPTRWMPKARKAVFRWERERQQWRRRGDMIACAITVPATELFNVSAYQPGDFKQFFNDPRTRCRYLEWADLLLRAEEFHAAKRRGDGDRKKKVRRKKRVK